MVFIRRG